MSDTITTTSKGILLPCPKCGEMDASIMLALAAPSDETAFACQECNGEFGRADIEAIIKRWTPILKWIDTMPASETE